MKRGEGVLQLELKLHGILLIEFFVADGAVGNLKFPWIVLKKAILVISPYFVFCSSTADCRF